MITISSYLTRDHRRCDDFFGQAEAAIEKGEWGAAAEYFAQFVSATLHHFGMEEEVMFPAFEQTTGNTMGPTRMMRMEHVQMRELLEQMQRAVAAHDIGEYAGLSETLLVLMQQHNLKEEQILYPMADQALASSQEEVVGRMADVAEA